ncbi:DUF1993 family protein [Umboniibacter marinipuniceus]|uniref:DUF1993 domain-containing protein n=1 Tax=Umboniibacter marinipuniceus TaxID=569599 RepID=A0A3M0AUE6_9GAMM|nr:DUF1993 family protein [Umboniibacter marinipuniceus]RMA82582.1 hypothetical protein DFR27_0533 [Umboniibacter marinipuniceus]
MTALYELSVASYLRVLDGTIATMKKAQAFYEQQGLSGDEALQLRVAEDMWELRRQLHSVRHHSLNAARGLLRGEFNPPKDVEETDLNGAIGHLVADREELAAITAAEINALSGKPMYFRMTGVELPFTMENFVMSFTLPNLYFHAATVYNLLRADGVPLGKRDFLGQMRVGLI